MKKIEKTLLVGLCFGSMILAGWLSWNNALIAAFFIHWALSLYPHSMFHHRYASHQQFSMSRASEKIWFVLSYLLQGPSYLSAKAYGIMHRLHHDYADTAKDPHSPSYSTSLFSMMWRTRNVYNEICTYLFTSQSAERAQALRRLTKMGITESDLLSAQRRSLPSWDAFDKFANSGASRIIWIGIYAFLYFFVLLPWSGESVWWSGLFLFHCIMAPAQGVMINWFAHTIGERVFKQSNTSTNIAWGIDWFMLGEGYHNDHHKLPASANFAFHKWWYIDPIYLTLWVQDKLGMIRLLKEK